MEYRSPVADCPTFSRAYKSNGIQSGGSPRGTHCPVSPSGTGKKNSAARADRPAVRVVEKKDVGEIFAPALGETTPGQTAVIGTHHQSISARRPSGVRIGKINS